MPSRDPSRHHSRFPFHFLRKCHSRGVYFCPEKILLCIVLALFSPFVFVFSERMKRISLWQRLYSMYCKLVINNKRGWKKCCLLHPIFFQPYRWYWSIVFFKSSTSFFVKIFIKSLCATFWFFLLGGVTDGGHMEEFSATLGSKKIDLSTFCGNF